MAGRDREEDRRNWHQSVDQPYGGVPVDSEVFGVLRAYFRVFRLGMIQTRATEIWKMRYEG